MESGHKLSINQWALEDRPREKMMEKGFRCIKLKIGAINFEEELTLLRHIRTHFSSKEIELRVGHWRTAHGRK